ncbi:MAG: BBP7 family outer membrane beta-barrel protein [Gemmataceae bacterium]
MKNSLPTWLFPLGLAALLVAGGLSRAQLPGGVVLTSSGPSGSPGSAPAVPLPIDDDGADERFWGRADYLLWWLKGYEAPALLTTSPATLVPLPGSFANPNTTVLVNGSNIVDNPFSGSRVQVGLWLDEQRRVGLEGSFFFLGSKGTALTVSSPGEPVLARPYFNTLTGAQESELLAFPGVASGAFTLNTSSEAWGFEANGVSPLCRTCDGGVYLIGGFRQLRLRETLSITESLLVSPNSPVFANNLIGVLDEFKTTNDFYGAQLGARGEYRIGDFFVGAVGKLALGVVQQRVDVQGLTTLTPLGGAPVVRAGGLLALPSNTGAFTKDRFGVLPEVGLTLGYQATENIRLNLGYTFLYLNSVARPGDQVPVAINDSQVPTNARTNGQLVGDPAPLGGVHTSDVWLQGLTFGVEVKF